MSFTNDRQMRTRPTTALLLLAAVLFAAAAPARAGLVENNPFLPEGWGKKKETPAPKPAKPAAPIERELEFRGVYEWKGEVRVGVFHKKKNKNFWIGVDDSAEGIKVVQYNPSVGTVILNYNGRTDTLEMMSPSDKPMAVPKAAAAAAAARTPANTPPGLPKAAPRPAPNSTGRATVPRRRVVLPRRN